MPLELLMDPVARGAYYGEVEAVAIAELRAFFPDVQVRPVERATLRLLEVSLSREEAPVLARLSWVQAVLEADGDALHVLDAVPGFSLPDSLVWGAKYRGKTHELVTQLAINVALQTCTLPEPSLLLDSLAGRGTTLLWGLRYGLQTVGIEQDSDALEHLQRHVKRQTKLHRLKHSFKHGGKGDGAFVDLTFPEPPVRLRLITGDSRNARTLLQNQRFDLLVTDLPYGVQFVGPGGTRNPLKTLRDCAPQWVASLKPGAGVVLIYNRLQPARQQLQAVFADQGLEILPFEAPHRMGDAIERDLLVMRKPG